MQTDLERVPTTNAAASSPLSPFPTDPRAIPFFVSRLISLTHMHTHARTHARPHEHNVVRAARTTVYSALYGPPALKRRAEPPPCRAGLSARDYLTGSLPPVRESPPFLFLLITEIGTKRFAHDDHARRGYQVRAARKVSASGDARTVYGEFN